MESEIQPKTYELAYHLSPDLDEAGVKVRVQELTELVSQAGGIVVNSKTPQHIHLSYMIKKKQYANFGLIDFSAPADTVEKINAQMKLQSNVFRYLLIKKPGTEGKELRTLGQYRARPRPIKTHETTAQEALKKAPKEKTKEEKEQLETEIEKVIEGL